MGAGLPISIAQFVATMVAAARAIDFTELVKAFRLDLIGKTKECFYESRGPDGTPWDGLKWPRPNSKGGDKPLYDTTALEHSVTAPGAEGNIDQVGANGFVWGSNLDYAGIHQKGGTIRPKSAKYLAIPATKEAKAKGSPRKWPDGDLKFRFGKKGGVATWNGAVQYYFAKEVTIPKREFLGVSDQTVSDWDEFAGDFVADQLVARLQKGFGGP